MLICFLTYEKYAMKYISQTKCSVDQNEIGINQAKIDLVNNEIKLGKVELSQKEIERIAFLLAHDLKSIAPLISRNILTVNEVYKLIDNQ
jgi:DNA-binding response OmpR family regulator